MKGLLIGVFFAIRGLFHFLNSIIILLFSFDYPWTIEENSSATNCGFVYLLSTLVIGVIGLILLSVAAKKYKYRERDEGLFNQHHVEEVYERYIIQAAENNAINRYSE